MSKTTENDLRAKQSLELFKNWLAKHQFIKYIGDDDIDDLLMFILRVKKFSMQKTYESIEFMIPFIKSHPDWYSNPTAADYEFTRQPNSPFLYLKNCDAEGRRVFIQKIKDFGEYESVKFLRRFYLTPFLINFDMNAQLNGFVIIFDFRGVDLNKLRRIQIHVTNDVLKISKNGMMKLKQLNIIGMPTFLKPIFEFAKHFTSAKILQRINFINDVEELSQHMDVSVLPKEYGGSSDELLDYAAFESSIAYINKFHKFDVNFSKIQEYENVGSFRKLEID